MALIAACGADPRSQGDQKQPRPAQSKGGSSFLGLNLGKPINFLQCSTYGPDGDYKVPSLQEKTPCWYRLRGGPTSQLEPPAGDRYVGVMFQESQVPLGVSTRAWASIDNGLLGSVVAYPAQDNDEDAGRIQSLLVSKYGTPNAFSKDAAGTWKTDELLIQHYTSGQTRAVIVRTHAFIESEAAQSQRERDAEYRKHAESL
jgi:hypothetical protein